MRRPPRKAAPGAKTLRAEESKHNDYPAVHDMSVDAAIVALDLAHRHMRCAGVALTHGNVRACVCSFEASRKALVAAEHSLSAYVGGE